jgi:hypothetical protein
MQCLVIPNGPVLCQGTTLVVPKVLQNEWGFSPCVKDLARCIMFSRFIKRCLKPAIIVRLLRHGSSHALTLLAFHLNLLRALHSLDKAGTAFA